MVIYWLLLATCAVVDVTEAQISTCPSGWLPFSQSCYWFSTSSEMLLPWPEAYNMCAEKNSNLVIVNSPGEQFFLYTNTRPTDQRNTTSFWIGLSDKDNDGTFRWVDGNQPTTFSNYAPGFPKNTLQLWDCGRIFTGNQNWETTDCNRNLGYICEIPCWLSPKQPVLGCVYEKCGSNYMKYQHRYRGFRYRYETQTKKTWQAAENECVNQGAHLASFHSQEEFDSFKGKISANTWIGLNDKDAENNFVWSDGTPFDFHNWDPVEPNNLGDEDCGEVNPIMKLNDKSCNCFRNYLCKKGMDLAPLGPPPTSAPGQDGDCSPWKSLNNDCYQFNYLNKRTWMEAQDECVDQGGNLASITDPSQMDIIKGVISQVPIGVSLWLGARDWDCGWTWTDGAPFSFTSWSAARGLQLVSSDEHCLSLRVSDGAWRMEHCTKRRGFICKRRNGAQTDLPHHDFLTALICQDPLVALECPADKVISIQSAFYRRGGDNICTQSDQSGAVLDTLGTVRRVCNNYERCRVFTFPQVDPCPSVHKCLDVTFTCEDNVCVRGLGVEDGRIKDSQVSASSSVGNYTADKGQINGNSCWMPSRSLPDQWLQVDLSGTRKVTGVVIQGCPHQDNWVTNLKLQHSLDGVTWSEYTVDGQVQVLPGSFNRDFLIKKLLELPVSARYIRVLPLEASGQAGLRLEVLGCSPDYAVGCDHKLNSFTGTKTIHCPAGCAQSVYTVYGTDKYRADSNTCAAAIHAGAIVNEKGGDITLVATKGRRSYDGSTRNGITTRQLGRNIAVSFTFVNSELRCPGQDWYQFGQYCYKTFEDKLTWTGAKLECASLRGNLVSVRSMKEQTWLRSYLTMATPADWNVWLGLSDSTRQGFYTWSDSHEVTFTNWAPRQPNSTTKSCVKVLHETGQWVLSPCTDLNAYTCKTVKGHYPPPAQATELTCPPAVPFTLPISGLKEGTAICLSGRVLPGAKEFNVNLQHGTGPAADVALHLNPRYDEGEPVVVVNSRLSGNYGLEKKFHSPLFPSGSSFSLTITVSMENYEMHVRGFTLQSFEHRLAFSLVDKLEVNGDVEIFSTTYRRSAVPGDPSICAPIPPEPYRSNIIGGLYPGMEVTLSGTVLPNANMFQVFFNYPSGTALMYRPRFDLNAVVRSSSRNNVWSAEQRDGGMPFVRGQAFMLTFKCEKTTFSIQVNGMQIHTFDYSVALEVVGDITLNCVSV